MTDEAKTILGLAAVCLTGLVGGLLGGYCLGRMGVPPIPIRFRKPVTQQPGREHLPDIAAELGFNEHPGSTAQPALPQRMLVVSPTSRSLMEHRAAQKEFERIRQTPPT